MRQLRNCYKTRTCIRHVHGMRENRVLAEFQTFHRHEFGMQFTVKTCYTFPAALSKQHVDTSLWRNNRKTEHGVTT